MQLRVETTSATRLCIKAYAHNSISLQTILTIVLHFHHHRNLTRYFRTLFLSKLSSPSFSTSIVTEIPYSTTNGVASPAALCLDDRLTTVGGRLRYPPEAPFFSSPFATSASPPPPCLIRSALSFVAVPLLSSLSLSSVAVLATTQTASK
ncbi:hypothetical protein Ahy_B02g057413 isoform A [Arachis hypogaea]|uniref:Uncharacterized protein n=1 Tax=Arachis hypogaea TaxID=3818 RepID=A0A445ABR9_ARAHY|nr:hypothetical protein Ahy_B02g057413 isoform A [Arachis hypogaea]